MAFQGSCYQFSTQLLDWFKAKDDCAEKDAHLVIINSQAEQVERGKGCSADSSSHCRLMSLTPVEFNTNPSALHNTLPLP